MVAFASGSTGEKMTVRGLLLDRSKGSVEMRTSVARFVKDESGATAIEYGLIAAGIAVAIIVAVNQVGTDLSDLFGRISGKLTAAGK
jgi:pilus assembly protein Flp/PilA